MYYLSVLRFLGAFLGRTLLAGGGFVGRGWHFGGGDFLAWNSSFVGFSGVGVAVGVIQLAIGKVGTL